MRLRTQTLLSLLSFAALAAPEGQTSITLWQKRACQLRLESFPSGNFVPWAAAKARSRQAIADDVKPGQFGQEPVPMILDFPLLAPGRSVDQLSGTWVIDHHNQYFDPKHEQRNTTHQLLQLIGKEFRAGTPLADMQRRLFTVSTNNLGDGAWAMWVARNVHRLYDDMSNGNQLYGLIAQAAHYEDFGMFGSRVRELVGPGNKAIRLQEALLARYDELIRQYGLGRSDRFDHLTAQQQSDLIEDALKSIDQAVDPRTSFVAVYNVLFERARKEALMAASDANQALLTSYRQSLEERGMNQEAAKQMVKELDGRVQIYDASRISGLRYGVFAAWAAAAQAHEKSLQLSVERLPNERYSFIVAVPHGKEWSRRLGILGKALTQAHLTKLPPLGEEARACEIRNFIGRDKLQANFAGVQLSAAEILDVVRDFASWSHGRRRSTIFFTPDVFRTPVPRPRGYTDLFVGDDE